MMWTSPSTCWLRMAMPFGPSATSGPVPLLGIFVTPPKVSTGSASVPWEVRVTKSRAGRRKTAMVGRRVAVAGRLRLDVGSGERRWVSCLINDFCELHEKWIIWKKNTRNMERRELTVICQDWVPVVARTERLQSVSYPVRQCWRTERPSTQ